MVSDRDCIIALFNAVAALAERMTGERMTVNLQCEDGSQFGVTGGASVTWLKAAETSGASGPAAE